LNEAQIEIYHDTARGQIILAFVVYILFEYALKKFREWNVMRQVSHCTINQVHDAMAQVCGRAVQGDEPLNSILSGKPVVYYRIDVERWHKGWCGNDWVPVYTEESTDPVYIEDETGRARVMIAEATLKTETDSTFRTGWLQVFPDEVMTLLKRLNIAGYDGTIKDQIRCRETILESGEELYVLGYGCEKDGMVEFNRRAPLSFIVSDRSESTLYFRAMAWWLAAGLTGLALGVLETIWILLTYNLC